MQICFVASCTRCHYTPPHIHLGDSYGQLTAQAANAITISTQSERECDNDNDVGDDNDHNYDNNG